MFKQRGSGVEYKRVEKLKKKNRNKMILQTAVRSMFFYHCHEFSKVFEELNGFRRDANCCSLVNVLMFLSLS